MKYPCCKYILGGITFIYDDIRCCCSNNQGLIFETKYNGKHLFDVEKMQAYRKEVIESCKKGIVPYNCKNCVELKEQDWDEKPLIDNIFLNYWDHCNCGCVYCIQENAEFLVTKHKKSRFYDVLPILKDLYKLGIVSKDLHFEMVGGEIAVLKEADDIVKFVLKHGAKELSFHTSGIKYSKAIELGLKNCEGCNFDFSLDCANRELYKKIKRIDAFEQVVSNIKKYMNCCPDSDKKVVAKYILIDGLNDNVEEVSNWLNLINNLGIKLCKIDVNFKKFFPEYNKNPIVPNHYYDIFDLLHKKAEEYNMIVCNWDFTERVLQEGINNK